MLSFSFSSLFAFSFSSLFALSFVLLFPLSFSSSLVAPSLFLFSVACIILFSSSTLLFIIAIVALHRLICTLDNISPCAFLCLIFLLDLSLLYSTHICSFSYSKYLPLRPSTCSCVVSNSFNNFFLLCSLNCVFNFLV